MSSSPIRVDALTAARARQRLLHEVICSEYWLNEIVSPADGTGDVWLIHEEAYPPRGRGRTPMRPCPSCRRICPPNGPAGSPCCDCQAEHDLDAMLKWIADPSRRDLAPELLRLSRVQGIAYSRFKENRNGGALGGFAEVEPYYKGAEWQPISDNEPPRSHFALAREAVEAADKLLRRHGGCCVALLPEDEKKLKDEIAHFAEHGTIMPRARKGFFRIVTHG